MTQRAQRNWPFTVEIHLADVLTWKFASETADVVVSSFGLKTFDLNQQLQLSQLVAKLLRPGGSFSFIEISVPSNKALCLPYMFYLDRVIPFIGRMFLGNPANYRMLGIYTREFFTAGILPLV